MWAAALTLALSLDRERDLTEPKNHELFASFARRIPAGRQSAGILREVRGEFVIFLSQPQSAVVGDSA